MNVEGTLLTVVGGVVTAFITALLTYLGVKNRSRVDVQASLNNGFHQLIVELQNERRALAEERGVLKAMVRHQDDEIMDLRRRVERLISTTTMFHNFIIANNLVPPQFDEDDVILGSNALGQDKET